MKTTVKTSETQAVAVEPAGAGIKLTVLNLRKPVSVVHVDDITIGALLFALEQAAQASQIAREREAERHRLMYPHGITA